MVQVGNDMPASALRGVVWRKSHFSNPNGNCVEVAELPDGVIAVRDSRHPGGPALVYGAAEMTAFIRGVKEGQFDYLMGLSGALGISGWAVAYLAGSPASATARGATVNSDQARDPASARAVASGALVGAHRGPAALRIALGMQLRRLREASHITSVEAADTIRATPSKISRLERGRTAAKQRDVADLLSLYGVTDPAEREELLEIVRQASAPGWWQQYSDVLPRWFESYIGLEKAASIIRSYEVQFVQGLLQTEDYARAVILIGNAHASAGEIDRRVSLRMGRQELLTQPGAPELWAVLDEAVLRRSPGGPKVMRAQLEHLLEVTELPNVTLQIVPFDAGPHAAAGGPFSILRFPEPDLPDLVYLEQLNSAVYLDHPEEVSNYLTIMDDLVVQAKTDIASRNMIRALLRQP